MACLAPNKLADGTEVACRECKLCQLQTRNKWVGRNIAESKTNKFCYIITATYGRGRVGEVLHERAVILTKSDVQKFMKLLRRHGYDVRVFYTGEYGSERQRAHWNIVLYSNEPLPAFSGWDQYGKWLKKAPYKKRFNWVRTDAKGRAVMLQSGQPAYWWPHGFVHVDDASVGNIQYVCKYVLKDFDGNGKQGDKGQSKDPPLGTEWFKRIAEKYVTQGLAPQSPAYRFPEARTKEGVVIDYWMTGRVLEIFLQHYIDTWTKVHGEKRRPPSQFVDLFEEYGRVVNDEQKMLARAALPRGEARGPMPGEAEWEEAKYQLATKKFESFANGISEADQRWTGEAKNEQERQKRQERASGEHVERWYAHHHKWGRHYFTGKGWRRPVGTEPCECCAVAERSTNANDAAVVELDGERRQPELLGKVGRWNRHYGNARPGAGPGDGGHT